MDVVTFSPIVLWSNGEIGFLSLGLGILATMLYNGRTYQEMAQVDQNVFIVIGLLNGLNPTRNNGLLAVFCK